MLVLKNVHLQMRPVRVSATSSNSPFEFVLRDAEGTDGPGVCIFGVPRFIGPRAAGLAEPCIVDPSRLLDPGPGVDGPASPPADGCPIIRGRLRSDPSSSPGPSGAEPAKGLERFAPAAAAEAAWLSSWPSIFTSQEIPPGIPRAHIVRPRKKGDGSILSNNGAFSNSTICIKFVLRSS